MDTAQRAFERGLALYRTLLDERPALARELAETRALFLGAGVAQAHDAASRRAADRRHLEWFLLERPSTELGGVPAEVLQDEWLRRAEPAERDLAPAFLESRAGAFEVTGMDDETGLWVRDLFGLGEYPVQVPVAHELALADLLVGRVFPVGDGTFRLSPAIAGFRDPGLLSAVRTDVERLRRGRRGVLRIEQIELERLFFDTPWRAAAAGDPRAAILAELAATGLAEDEVADVVHAIETAASAAAGEDAMTELLNRLAFDTSVDLGRVRVALIELRALARRPRPRRAAPARRAEASASVAAALAKFDEGRAAGADLEVLFRELESDLGVDSSDDEDGGEAEAPDFPGVVGAMVEEFLWELERERGDAAAAASAELRLLGRYAEKIGVYENLGARDLLDFAARWLLDEGEVHDAERAARILEALRGFCLWSEERHAHPLWSSFAPLWRRLRESLPRIAALRARAEPAPDAGSAQEVLAVDAGTVELKVPLGGAPARTVTIEPSLAAALRPGDLVRLSEATDGARLAACYPPELKELLASKGSGPRS